MSIRNNIILTDEIIKKYIINASNDDVQECLKQKLSTFRNYEIEIGSGNGKFLVEHALENPDTHFIGIEYSLKAAKKTLSKAYKRNLKNITILFGEANNIIENILKENYLFDKAYLNFPDPWPKKRHTHRRIFTTSFLSLVHSILKDDALFHAVTDDTCYALETITPILESTTLFENALDEKYKPYLEGYKVTLYEEKMRAKGLSIHFFVYKKV